MKLKLLLLISLTSSFTFAQSWNTTGNSGTDSSTHFIGTTDSKDFVIKTNNIERMRINSSGNIGIGTTPNVKRALNFFGNTEFITDTADKDSYHFFNSGQNVNNGLDLMWLSYTNYQANDVGILTLSSPRSAGTASLPVFSVRGNGKVFIGTAWNNPTLTGCADCNEYKLFVKDGIKTEKVTVELASANGWADYVFKKDYTLLSLEEVEKHIEEKGHLPNIPSAEQVVKDGINLGEMDAKLLEKIEELTLYSIEQNKQIKQLQEQNKILKTQSEEFQQLKEQVQQLLSSKK